ncbi:hypothetical protein [Legionella cincinnatiensis]|uniref:Uncharacterized protein n=1 Tax=Legionella cincinnatiensis TaxID=28085 RepID=A0A378IR90_9GAMM|nr:hypothetical protein [Legionella cincinnatiensis]KTC83537.1 hypothetical protein Lcin_2224 [Legionella cincinnatiensis]STX34504.1 Uncharacterised protein [Legionella cincinnatiensis]
MRYKVSEQFARGEEKAIAEFRELSDAKIFIAQKQENTRIEKQKIIFRLYDDSDLLHEFNENNSSVAYAKYADGNGDLNIIKFPYHVMIKAQHATDKKCIANFIHKINANLFVISKCDSDDQLNENDLFFIFKEQNLIDTLNKIICTHRKIESDRSNDNEKGAKFHPTPLPKRPRPPGGPSDCWIEENNENE